MTDQAKIGWAFLARDPEVSRLRALVEYLRAIEDDEYLGGEFIFGIDTRTDQSTVDLISTWPGAKVVPIEWEDDFSKARNEVIQHVEAPWTAYLDPDEIPSHPLLWWIHERVRDEKTKPLGYLWFFRSYFGGTNRRFPETEADWHIRMWRTGTGHFYRPVHELVRINGLDESASRGRPEVVAKTPEGSYVIHAKPPGNVESDSRMYDEIEKGKRKKK